MNVIEGDRMSLVFGSSGNSGAKFYGVEFRKSGDRDVMIYGFQDHGSGVFLPAELAASNVTFPVPVKINVTATGMLTIFVNNSQVKTINLATIGGGYVPGRLGLLTFNSKVEVSDVAVDIKDTDGFVTNTTNWARDTGDFGAWMVTSEGLRGIGLNTSFCFSASAADDFVYETDMTFKSGAHCGGVTFRANSAHTSLYGVDIANDERQSVRLLLFSKNGNSISDVVLGTGYFKDIPGYTKKNSFHIRIEAIKANINLYIDGHLLVMANNSQLSGGNFGVFNYNSDVVFQNTKYTPFAEMPRLTGLTVDADLMLTFSEDVLTYNPVVPYSKKSILITPSAAASNSISVNGEPVNSGSSVSVPLEEGMNVIKIKVTDTATNVSSTTVLNVKRKENPENTYLEKYRPQYHFTPERNWMNDPNGMVYYEGEYHLFFQYTTAGKLNNGYLHWGHAISKDLIHWDEYPIALYPDQYGVIYSGSAVVDENNTTGFFTDLPEKKGLVAIYTSHSGSEQQAIAYSKDRGRTWIKYNGGEPVIKASQDPYGHRDFRDPKVFWHDDKWMMAVAGGPLRFFSSPNLIDWTFESGYANVQTIDGKQLSSLFTECPDFFKLPVEGGTGDKWILTNSGRTYIIGDFKKIDGKWYFIPDSDTRFKMNFGNDTYAAQTYSNTPDGRRIMINWMHSLDYLLALVNVTDPYCGAFTLQNEIKLKQTPNGIKLYQTPVEEYKKLRTEPFVFENVTVASTTGNILKDIKGNQYEIVAELRPNAGNAKVGFNVAMGNGQVTKIYYNTTTSSVVIDRTQSGASPNNNFLKVYSESVPLDNKAVKLRIFVDWSSVEVYVNDGIAVGTTLIFPNPESTNIELFVEGASAKCNVTVYPLQRIWKEPTDDGDNTKDVTTQKSGSDVSVYSAEDSLIVEWKECNGSLNLDIFDIGGRCIYANQQVLSSSTFSLNKGAYIVRMSHPDWSAARKVIVK